MGCAQKKIKLRIMISWNKDKVRGTYKFRNSELRGRDLPDVVDVSKKHENGIRCCMGAEKFKQSISIQKFRAQVQIRYKNVSLTRIPRNFLNTHVTFSLNMER